MNSDDNQAATSIQPDHKARIYFFVLLSLVISICFIPNFLPSRLTERVFGELLFQSKGRITSDMLARESLRSIVSAQSLYVERSQSKRYASSMRELGKMGLINEGLASGEIHGYNFKIVTGEDPEYEYKVIARPVDRNIKHRVFMINEKDELFWLDQAGNWRRWGR